MPVPMTILGGYLGAGKTTVVNRVLTRAAGMRIVVVVNDFGDVNVDEELIASRNGDTIGLANGCVCCNLSEGMAAVIERIRALRPPPDHVLIEVSGVGDPGPVAAWAAHPGFRHNAVLVCADAQNIEARSRDRWVGDTVRAQLHAGDLILLTKSDVTPSAVLAATRAWLARFAPEVPVVDVHDIDVIDLLSAPAVARSDTAADAGAHDVTRHRSWVLRSNRPVDLDVLRGVIRTAPPGVVRIKGIVRTSESPGRRTVINAVGRHCDVSDAGQWDDGRGEAESHLVIIATGELPAGAEQELLARLLPGPGAQLVEFLEGE